MKAENANNLNIKFPSSDDKLDIFFQFRNGHGEYSPEAEIALRLLPSMQNSEDLKLDDKSIDPLFYNSLIDIQHIYNGWNSKYNIIKITGRHKSETKESSFGSNRIATFFSGGVDSFYTFLKHQSEITDIVFIHGLDIPLENTELRQQTVTALTAIAQKFNIHLLEVETNLREKLSVYAEWGTILHGVALATVGLLLQNEFSTIYIPASHDYSNLFPWGTHPILDHLWSTERTRFIHDGAEATRLQKVELISNYDTALQQLRVCWRNIGGKYNCCKCEKCLRTMISLYGCGKLEACPTFPEPLSINRVAKMKLKGKNTRNFARENIRKLEHMENAIRLRKALKKALRTSMFKKIIKQSYK